MKFVALLSIVGAAIILIAAHINGPAVTQTRGGPGSTQVGSSAPFSFASLFTTKSAAPSSSSSANPAVPANSTSPGVLDSALAFFKRGFDGAATHRTSWQPADLRIARGTVVAQFDTGVVMDCSAWIVKSATNGIYAGDGVGMNALYANLVDAHEQFAYGRLMTVDRGITRQSTYNPATWTTGSYLSGPVLLKGYPSGPLARGRGLKVVVAPDGDANWQGNPIPAYTASFTLTN
jgi:hypothetical protein